MDSQTFLALLLRHALGWVAGALLACGYIDSSMTEGFISAGMGLGVVLWSMWQKKGQAEVLAFARAELAKLKAAKAPLTSQAIQDAMARKP